MTAPSSRPSAAQDHADTVRRGLGADCRKTVWPADHRCVLCDGHAALDALLALLAEAQQERDNALIARDAAIGHPAIWGDEDRRKVAAYDAAHYKVKRDCLSRAEYVLRAEAAEALAERRRVGLQAIIDYVPEGFISPMDDEDSMNYRAIARAALARLSAGKETT